MRGLINTIREMNMIKEDGHVDVSSSIRKCKTAMEDASQILSKLQTKSVTVVILSPVDTLISRLQSSAVFYLDNTRICSTADLNKCIQQGFDKARKIN